MVGKGNRVNFILYGDGQVAVHDLKSGSEWFRFKAHEVTPTKARMSSGTGQILRFSNGAEMRFTVDLVRESPLALVFGGSILGWFFMSKTGKQVKEFFAAVAYYAPYTYQQTVAAR